MKFHPPTEQIKVESTLLEKLVERCRSLPKCHCVLAHFLRWRKVETMRKGKPTLTADELRELRQFFVRWLHSGMAKDLLDSVSEDVA